jgi:putative hemolysin
MHPPVVVPLTKKVDEMFDFFQERNARAAAVLNEFGGVEGFVTMKDVLTFIFGQISGEVQGLEHYQERDENYYEVRGDMKLNDFNNLANFGIEDPRMTTIGGVAFRHLDRLPRVGDQVSVEGITITILEMDEHRIARVRVSRGEGAEEAATVDQPGTDTPDEAATAATAAGEPGGHKGAVSGEDTLAAGKGPANEPDSGPAYPANEPGKDNIQSDRESKALH